MTAGELASRQSDVDPALDDLDPYTRLIADEALRRGIAVKVLDAKECFLSLSYGGREIVARDALSELTSAVAMVRCADKRLTRKLFAEAGLRVPRGREASSDDADADFLEQVGELVVKPASGEQGHGITVGVRDRDELTRAVDEARRYHPAVLLEEFVDGHDLRVIVIDHEVVAAAVRRPPRVVGNGRDSIARLIEAQSRRRAEQTGGQSTIPVDDHTRGVVAAAGYSLDDVLSEGEVLLVRRTANVHAGGTIDDVTDRVRREVADACVRASRILRIPLVGLDLVMPAVDAREHVFIEANERPGLLFHDPQPTAERYMDLLFPETRGR
ncbi:MAG TPA: ATP-grasp domain-containing protein [Egibacteraceae bacterium]|jgi:GNAT-family acetyltransferase (TIGR03103 family)|nr:ATP-grasp domain-containing protein [Egibacteraceae bacterium]